MKQNKMKVHQPRFGLGNIPHDFFKQVTQAPSLKHPATPVSVESIKNLLDPVKQSKLQALITYCEEHNNQSLANRLKFHGIPKGIYATPELLESTRETFHWMGCKVVEHRFLGPGQIIFSWADDIYNLTKE